MPKEYTSRGFAVYKEIKDTRGNEITIQESSNADEDCVWVFCKRDGKDDTPHLNIEQAKQVIEALQEFIDEYED